MPYKLGTASLKNLEGVHPVLVRIVMRAIEISEQDFSVNEGVRTPERQRKLFDAGASHTLNSMHIPQKDRLGGTKSLFGHAVDLTPWVDGTPRWEWGLIYPIAAAMARAAQEQLIVGELCWGGVWDEWIETYAGDAAAMKKAVVGYQKRHPGPDFIDGPHFQVGRLR